MKIDDAVHAAPGVVVVRGKLRARRWPRFRLLVWEGKNSNRRDVDFYLQPGVNEWLARKNAGPIGGDPGGADPVAPACNKRMAAVGFQSDVIVLKNLACKQLVGRARLPQEEEELASAPNCNLNRLGQVPTLFAGWARVG